LLWRAVEDDAFFWDGQKTLGKTLLEPTVAASVARSHAIDGAWRESNPTY
jgi:hypothetical protein